MRLDIMAFTVSCKEYVVGSKERSQGFNPKLLWPFFMQGPEAITTYEVSHGEEVNCSGQRSCEVV